MVQCGIEQFGVNGRKNCRKATKFAVFALTRARKASLLRATPA
jgi:hypothetical protein